MPKDCPTASSLRASIGLLLIAAAVASSQPFVHQASNRAVTNINAGWLFSPTDVANGQSTTLNESSFQPVCIPHTTKVIPHITTQQSAYQIVAWYRKHITIPSTYAGRRIRIHFQGVSIVGQVYVNGQLVGEHKGPYTPFIFDITDKVAIGADNIIAVRVDATRHTDIPPDGGNVDYFIFGGIVRDVELIVSDPLYTEWIFATTPSASATSATVNARTRVVNKNSTARNCTAVTSVTDAAGNVVATGTATQSIPADSAFEFNYALSTITNPKLWHPDRPNLYTVYTQIKDGATFVDEHRERIGIRTIQFNKTDGKFYINGSYLKLFGLNRHETYPFIGRAAANRLQARDADLLKYQMGCNMVRCSHYPQDPEFLSRCDEIGLMVIEEIPGWQFIGNAAWQTILKKNLEEMVMRDRNHPSVMSWGVRVNESADDNALYTWTNNRARQLDPSRPTYGHRIGSAYGGTQSQFLEDIFSISDYSGGIEAPVAPRMPHLVGECHEWWKYVNPWGSDAEILTGALHHAYIHNEAFKRTDVLGSLAWCAFSYNSTVIGENGLVNDGASDILRFPLHTAYFYQSQSDPAVYGPMVYLATRWESGSSSTVTVFTNCQSVELFVNGTSRGSQTPSLYTSLPHPVVQFTGITYAAGEIKAVGSIGGSAAATHIRKTPGAAARLVVSPDDSNLVIGGDMTRVAVRIVDANGNPVYSSGTRVTVSASGAGIFLGESPISLEGGQTAFFVQTKESQTGTITCSATATGLTAGSAAIAVGASQATAPRQNLGPGSTRRSATATVSRIVAGGSQSLSDLLTNQQGRVAVYSIGGRLIRAGTARDLLEGGRQPKTADGIVIVRMAPRR